MNLTTPWNSKAAALRILAAAGLATAWLPLRAATADAAVANPKCADLGYELELKIDPPQAGHFASSDGLLEVEVTFTGWTGNDPKVMDWTSDYGVDAALLKAGRAGHGLYEYDPAALSGSGLTTPGTGNAISHILFCYSATSASDPAGEPDETSTPAPDATETPVDEPTDEPTSTPSPEATETPVDQPTDEPTSTPSPEATETPVDEPTDQPTDEPTSTPSPEATETPVDEPTDEPTSTPSPDATKTPVDQPTEDPSSTPTPDATEAPVDEPTEVPSSTPTPDATATPVDEPTEDPSSTPTPDATQTPDGGIGPDGEVPTQSPEPEIDEPVSEGPSQEPRGEDDSSNDNIEVPTGDWPVPTVSTRPSPQPLPLPTGETTQVLAGIAPPMQTAPLALPNAGNGAQRAAWPLSMAAMLLAAAGLAGIGIGARRRTN